MSSRQLRRLRGNRVFDLAEEILANDGEGDSSGSDDDEEESSEETFEEYERRMLAQKQAENADGCREDDECNQASSVNDDYIHALEKQLIELDALPPPKRKSNNNQQRRHHRQNNKNHTAKYLTDADRKKMKSQKKSKKKKNQYLDSLFDEYNHQTTSLKKKTKKKEKGKDATIASASSSSSLLNTASSLESKQERMDQEDIDNNDDCSSSMMISINRESLLLLSKQLDHQQVSDANVRNFVQRQLLLIDPSLITRLCSVTNLDLLDFRTTINNSNHQRKKHNLSSSSSSSSSSSNRKKRSEDLKKGRIVRCPNADGHWPLPFKRFALEDGNLTSDVLFVSSQMMIRNSNQNELICLGLEWDDRYDRREQEFNDKLRTLGDAAMIQSTWLSRIPYHVGSLLWFSRRMGNAIDGQSLKHEVIERALYRLDLAISRRVDFTMANARIPLDRCPLNRNLFEILFQQCHCFEAIAQETRQSLRAINAINRACFELCKLTLGLNPVDDPMYLLLCLDYWALKNEEYEYVVEFADSFPWLSPSVIIQNGSSLLSKCSATVKCLPNFAYSKAIAMYFIRRSRQKTTDHQNHSDDNDDGSDGSSLLDFSSNNPDRLMEEAMVIYPLCLTLMMKKLSPLLNREQSSRWFAMCNARNAPLFGADGIGREMVVDRFPSVRQISEAFCQRGFEYWKQCLIKDENDNLTSEQGLLDWMLECAERAQSRIVEGVLDEAIVRLVRASLYGELEKDPKWRRLDISEWMGGESIIAMVDEAIVQNIERLDIAGIEGVARRMLHAGRQLPKPLANAARQGRELKDMGFVSGFFYSMLPWVHPIFLD